MLKLCLVYAQYGGMTDFNLVSYYDSRDELSKALEYLLDDDVIVVKVTEVNGYGEE